MTATTNWVPIYGYEDSYEISSNAEVRAIGATTIRSNGRTYTSKRKMLKQQINKDGYITVTLYKSGKKKRCMLHRLMLLSFIGASADPMKTEVNHKDEDKTNNSVENLEWCDKKYNANYGSRPQRIGVKSKELMQERARKVDMFTSYGLFVRTFDSIHDAAAYFGCRPSNIHAVLTGRYIQSHGFKFKYHEKNGK